MFLQKKTFSLSKNTQNLGLQILKMLLCFWIVMVHTCRVRKNNFFHMFFQRKYHVPAFLIMSFYFLYKHISERNIPKMKQRFERLLIPYIIVPIIIWIFNNLLYIFHKFNRFGRKLTIRDLIKQIIIGRIFHRIFWYQFNLIFITLLFTIISFIFMKKFLIILNIFVFVSYILQYSGYHIKFFFNYSVSIRCSLGNTVEVMPSTVIGLFLGSINLIENLKINRFKILFFSFIYIYFLFKYDIFINILGFYYPGIMHNFGALLLFIFFSLIPFENIKNKKTLSFIKFISNYTGGIYYLHPIIRDNIDNYKINIRVLRNRNIYRSLIIYLICFCLCFIGIKIFGKTRMKYLFF